MMLIVKVMMVKVMIMRMMIIWNTSSGDIERCPLPREGFNPPAQGPLPYEHQKPRGHAKRPRAAPRDPERPQEAPGGPERPPEASRRPQRGPRRPQEAPPGPSRECQNWPELCNCRSKPHLPLYPGPSRPTGCEPP